MEKYLSKKLDEYLIDLSELGGSTYCIALYERSKSYFCIVTRYSPLIVQVNLANYEDQPSEKNIVTVEEELVGRDLSEIWEDLIYDNREEALEKTIKILKQRHFSK